MKSFSIVLLILFVCHTGCSVIKNEHKGQANRYKSVIKGEGVVCKGNLKRNKHYNAKRKNRNRIFALYPINLYNSKRKLDSQNIILKKSHASESNNLSFKENNLKYFNRLKTIHNIQIELTIKQIILETEEIELRKTLKIKDELIASKGTVHYVVSRKPNKPTKLSTNNSRLIITEIKQKNSVIDVLRVIVYVIIVIALFVVVVLFIALLGSGLGIDVYGIILFALVIFLLILAMKGLSGSSNKIKKRRPPAYRKGKF